MTTKNNFTKQEKVAFERLVTGFEEALVYDKLVNTTKIGAPAEAMRANDTLWIPKPLRLDSQEGQDQTGNFVGITELSVPAKVNRFRSVPISANARALRDGTFLERAGKAARRKLASDVNGDIRSKVAFYGSIVDAQAGKATGFDDVMSLAVKFDELGVPMNGRKAVYSTSDFAGMVANLSARQTLTGKTQTAYEKAYVDEIAGFEILKDPSAVRLNGATATGVTVSLPNQRHTPKSTITNAVGDEYNVDNRFMTLTVNVGGGEIKAGDAFTIAGVYAVHHENKGILNTPKTFRVTRVLNATQIEITPAITCDDYVGATNADTVYKNVSATPAQGAAITFLNKRTTLVNTSFVDDAVEFIPSTLALDELSGMAFMQAQLSNGLTMYYTRQGDINDLSCKIRWDIVYGTAVLDPEMIGIQLFNQG